MLSKPPEYVTALLSSSAYSYEVAEIDLRETHISYVHIAGDYVFKTKKPVDFGFISQISIESRKKFCDQEVLLNRRLAPSVYLEVVSVVRLSSGQIVVDPPADRAAGSEILEWAVKMRRLPENATLAAILKTGGSNLDDLAERLAVCLFEFHKNCKKVDPDVEFAGPKKVKEWWDRELAEISEFIDFTLSRRTYQRLLTSVETMLEAYESILLERLETGRVVEGHGDLHCDHIYLLDSFSQLASGRSDGIAIVDGIEFNDWFQFRYLDVGYELAFLAMDMTALGHEDLANELVGRYIVATGDETLSLLQPLHRLFRAFVRGKIASITSQDSGLSREDRQKSELEASTYFSLAVEYAPQLSQAMSVVMCGVSGSGKSLVGATLASKYGFAWLNSDVIRKEMFGVAVDEALSPSKYSDVISQRVYERMLEKAQIYISRGQSVVMDATHLTKAQRLNSVAFATQSGALSTLMAIDIDAKTAEARVLERMNKAGNISDATSGVLKEQLGLFERLNVNELKNGIMIPANLNLAEQISLISAHLESVSQSIE